MTPDASSGGAGAARPRGGLGNDFGLGEALLGLLAGMVLVSLAASLVGAAHLPKGPGATLATDGAGLAGWWAGFLGGAVVASRRRDWTVRLAPPTAPRPTTTPSTASAATRDRRRPLLRALGEDYGLSLRLWPDVPLGIAVGVASQYLLVPLLELPLTPFVPHLFHRLGHPAETIVGQVHGPLLVLLGLLICVGAPLFEELMFRGLLLRALAGRLAGLGPRLGPVVAVVLTGVVFGLVHFEALQLLALAGFGMVLCLLAWRTGRLGPGIVAHAAFNAVSLAVIAAGR